jgi:hypothetical protein
MLTILIRKETRRELSGLRDDDILIRPKLGEYASTNFVDIAETIAPGAEATIDMNSPYPRTNTVRFWQLVGPMLPRHPASISFVWSMTELRPIDF